MTMWFILTITLLCHTSFALNPDWQIYQYGPSALIVVPGNPSSIFHARYYDFQQEVCIRLFTIRS